MEFEEIRLTILNQAGFTIDRTNENIAYLYNPLHSSILRTINWIVKVEYEHGIKVAMCGEMAGEARYTLILLGLGLDELSMNPISIPLIKSIIRSVTLEDADYVISRCQTLQDVDESYLFCIEEVLERTPEEYHLHGLL